MSGRQFDLESGQEDGAAHGDGPPWSTDARRVDTAPDPRMLVSVPEAARMLSIGRTRAFRLVNANYLVSVKIGRSRLGPVWAIQNLVMELVKNPNLLSRF